MQAAKIHGFWSVTHSKVTVGQGTEKRRPYRRHDRRRCKRCSCLEGGGLQHRDGFGKRRRQDGSQLVLLNSDFASMPLVVKEGRRSINNLQRSASLFLVKTIFSTLIAIFFIFVPVTYPMEPIQLTLISVFTIERPPSYWLWNPIRNAFMAYLYGMSCAKRFPAALTMTLNLIMLTAITQFVGFTDGEFSTLCVIMNGFTGLLMLLSVCKPLNTLRTALFCAMMIGFMVAAIFFQSLFGLVPVTASMLVVLIPMMFFCNFPHAIACTNPGKIILRSSQKKSRS